MDACRPSTSWGWAGPPWTTERFEGGAGKVLMHWGGPSRMTHGCDKTPMSWEILFSEEQAATNDESCPAACMCEPHPTSSLPLPLPAGGELMAAATQLY